MNNFGRAHPLDKLINDDSLFLLEAMVPFVDYQYKLPLIFYIKYRELTLIMQCMNDKNYVSQCGFDCHPKNQEEMFGSICSFLPGDYANTFKQMKQMMAMMDVMNSMPKQNNNTNEGNYENKPDNNEYGKSDNTGYSNFNNDTYSENGGSDDLYESVMSILNERT